jgi:hypothetical protein
MFSLHDGRRVIAAAYPLFFARTLAAVIAERNRLKSETRTRARFADKLG